MLTANIKKRGLICGALGFVQVRLFGLVSVYCRRVELSLFYKGGFYSDTMAYVSEECFECILLQLDRTCLALVYLFSESTVYE